MKRFLAFLCASVLFFTGFPLWVTAEEAAGESVSVVADTDYENAVAFLQALSLVGNLNFDMPEATVSRADFASAMLSLLGFQSADGQSAVEDNRNKYLGYTNDPDLDENGDWIWNTEESQEEEVPENATPFYDVLSTDPRWEDIKMAAQIGIMRGDSNRYFRPDDAVSVQEALKVLVDACGAKILTENNFPSGYITIAKRLELDTGLGVPIGEGVITVRDIAIAFYNAMHTEIYERVSYGSEKSTIIQRQGKTLLKYVFQLDMTEGQVTADSVTGLSSYQGTGGALIKIDDALFYWTETERILGRRVRAYYKVDGTRKEIRYLAVSDTNREVVIDAEDIVDYALPYLSYWDGDRQRSVSVGADINLIYNGKALLDYQDADLKPDKGRVRLLDSDGDGGFETVFVEDVKTLWVSGVDASKEIIYSNLSGVESLDVSKGTLAVYDAAGTKLEFSSITRNAVLSVMQTKSIQGEPHTVIYYSANSVKASVEQINTEKREVVLNGTGYRAARRLDMTALEAGFYGIFYLDVYNEIVHFEAEGELQYGYLMAMQSTGVFGGTYQVKLYHVADDEFVVYELDDKLTFNKESMSAENAAKNALIYDSAKGKLIPQLIKFALNSDGCLKELLTCDVKKDEFAAMTNVSNKNKLQYREGKINAFIDTKDGGPLFYADSDTRFINIPETDATDEESYYPITVEHDEYYYLDEVYKDGEDSSIGKIAVRISDASASAAVEWGQPVYMVTEVEQTLVDGEDAYVIYGMSTNGEAQVQVTESDLFDTAKSLKRGDLYRFELNQKTGKALLLEKLFDHEKMQMIKGFMKGINPFASTEDSATKRVAFINELHLLHGEVVNTTDNGAFLTVSPYLYEFTNNEVTGVGALSGALADRITYKASVYAVIVYDSKRDMVSVGSYNGDILDSTNTAEGSEVVVYSNWSNPRCIFVYK